MELDSRLDDFEAGGPVARTVALALRIRNRAAMAGTWSSLAELGELCDATPDQMESARAMAHEAGSIAVVEALDSLDGADGVWSSLRAAADVVRSVRDGEGHRPPIEARQGQDAIHKALVLAWTVGTLFPGSPEEQVAQFLELESGQALVGLFGLVEVALPFFNEAPESGLLARLATLHGEDGMRVVEAHLGTEAAGPIQQCMPVLVTELERAVMAAAKEVDLILGTVEDLMPVLSAPLDAGAKAVAAGLDLLPAYHVLGPRLVAEAAVKQAMREDGDRVASDGSDSAVAEAEEDAASDQPEQDELELELDLALEEPEAEPASPDAPEDADELSEQASVDEAIEPTADQAQQPDEQQSTDSDSLQAPSDDEPHSVEEAPVEEAPVEEGPAPEGVSESANRSNETLFDFMDDEEDELGATEIAVNPLLIPEDEEEDVSGPLSRRAQYTPPESTSTAQPKRRSRLGMLLFVAVVGLTLLGCCGLTALLLGGVGWYVNLGPGGFASMDGSAPTSTPLERNKSNPRVVSQPARRI